MRKYLLIGLVLVTSIGCQKNVIAGFNLHIENLDKYDESKHDIIKIEIYKNNKIFKILKSELPVTGLSENIKIDSIKEGKYLFVYENIFGKEVKTEVAVDDLKGLQNSITPDKLNEKNKNLAFENIKNDEVKLIYKSSGCFHMEKDSITILNKGNEYFTKENNYLKKIDKKNWTYFVNLEDKIRQVPKEGGCTTVDSFIFNYKGKSDTLYDATCDLQLVSTIINYRKKNKL